MSRPLSPDEIYRLPLKAVCNTISEHWELSGNRPSGLILAHVAKRLIASEVTPGGPYKNEEGSTDLPTNLAVARLCSNLGTPLPNVITFLLQATPRSLTKKEYLIYLQITRKAPAAISPNVLTAQAIFTEVKREFHALKAPLPEFSLSFIERLEQADTHHEITLLPLIFHRSLRNPFASPQLLTHLGKANVYCWLAYSIYDAIIDGEEATDYLPTANIAMRQAMLSYQNLFPSDHPFQRTLASVFTAMDSANAWELKNCRAVRKSNRRFISTLPHYMTNTILAKRSFGHVLGPIALASLHPSGLPTSLLEKGLRHYLIARQLSDDMHDWQKDITAGHLSPVVVHILRQAKRGSSRFYDTDPLPDYMTQLFWSRTFPHFNQLIHRHATFSLECLDSYGDLNKNSEFHALVSRLGNMAMAAADEHTRYRTFLETFRELSIS